MNEKKHLMGTAYASGLMTALTLIAILAGIDNLISSDYGIASLMLILGAVFAVMTFASLSYIKKEIKEDRK